MMALMLVFEFEEVDILSFRHREISIQISELEDPLRGQKLIPSKSSIIHKRVVDVTPDLVRKRVRSRSDFIWGSFPHVCMKNGEKPKLK